MQVKVAGRHMTVTDPTRAYAEEKFGRIGHIYDDGTVVADVVLDVSKNRSHPDRFTAEATIRLKGHVVRAEESSSDMHAAIDLAADKAEAQMRKYKSRVVDRRTHSVPITRTAPGDDEIVEEEVHLEVSRVKTVDAKPMTEEEAILQLELLGHDFFVFRHAETEDINVIYRRTGGDYALIQTRT